MSFVAHRHPVVLPTLRWFMMDNSRPHMALRQNSTLFLLGCIALLFLSFKTLVQYQDSVISTTEEIGDTTEESFWGGWESVEKIFVFGDSWSDTFFNHLGDQPSIEQPLGNPPFPGTKDTKGAKWPVHLTTAYNDSLIQTYVFSISGASVAGKPWNHTFGDFISEVEERFLPNYVDHDFGHSNWSPETSLFTVFFGINDNVQIDDRLVDGRIQEFEVAHKLQKRQLTRYEEMMDKLYLAGARNFLVMNVPPLSRQPSPIGKPTLVKTVANWNALLVSLVSDFRTDHPGSTIHEFDTHTFMNQVMDNPLAFHETAQYHNVTDQCKAYSGKDLELDNYAEECGLPLREYLWWDSLHPTGPFHEALAGQIAELLRNEKTEESIDTAKETKEGKELRRLHKHWHQRDEIE